MNSTPSLPPPMHLRTLSPGPGSLVRLDDPVSVHFPQVLSSSPYILERAAMRIGWGILWSVCDWWSETLLQRQKKTSYPKLYKHTLHSLNVFVKYWKHLELHSAAPLTWTHTRLRKARRVLGASLAAPPLRLWRGPHRWELDTGVFFFRPQW